MITPISAINLAKTYKIKQTKQNSTNLVKNKTNYINSQNINFTHYMGFNKPVEFEKTLKNNWFRLPKVTRANGEIYQIKPDKSQLACAKHLYDGKSVVFDAPTGMGKTSIAHWCATKNSYEGKKTIYTVPIKALANDKYNEFCKIYGTHNIGILTGDRKINPNAPIVIMVTEIFQNQTASLTDGEARKIGTVIYDEAHYVGDEDRGGAWENSIKIACEKGIQVLCLSATIGNCEEFTNWIGSVSSRPTVRVEVKPEQRPVPLSYSLFKEGELVSLTNNEVRIGKYPTERQLQGLSVLYRAVNNLDEYYELSDKNYEEIYNDIKKLMGAKINEKKIKPEEFEVKLEYHYPGMSSGEIEVLAEFLGDILEEKTPTDELKSLFDDYKVNFGYKEAYELEQEDYQGIFNQLKELTEFNKFNGLTCTAGVFKAKLATAFRSLDEKELELITQLMSNPENKKVKEIHTPYSEEDLPSLIKVLDKKDMLPAIIFKLAQGGCEDSARNMLDINFENNNPDEEDLEEDLSITEDDIIKSNVDLLSADEKRQVQEILDKYEDMGVYLGHDISKEMLLRGFGVHHAGRMPQYKKLVEELFSKKLMKVVISTSTLGAGINMPAKTVVMTNTAYKKYNHETKEFEFTPLNANEFHQMAGRAGRRGIDQLGNVVLYNLRTPASGFNSQQKTKHPKTKLKVDELELAYKLIQSDANNIRSAFRPEATMLANYYKTHNNNLELKGLIEKSLKVFLAKDKSKEVKQLVKKFENYSHVLLKQGFITKNHKNEITLTPKGEILAQSQGMNPLILANLIFEEKLATISTEQLCEIAGLIAGCEEQVESKDVQELIQRKIEAFFSFTEGGTSEASYQLQQFEIAKAIYKNREEKVIKALKEANVSHCDIRYANAASGLITYLFAKMNSEDENSISNFEKITQGLTSTVQASNPMVQKELDAKLTEGNVYRTITQSISVLKQIIKISNFALQNEDLYPNSEYYQGLKEKAKEAITLLEKEPINNDPNYENKSSKF